MKHVMRWGAGLVLAPVFLLTGCADSPGIDPDTGIITGRIPGDHEHQDVVGTVAAVEGCIGLELSDGVVYPIIWPLGFQLQPANASIGDGNGTVVVGEKLTESRGYLIAREEFGSFSDPAQLTGFDECSPDAETFLVLVDVEDFDAPE